MLPFTTALLVLAFSCQTLPPDSGSQTEPESDRQASIYTTNTATLRFQEGQVPVKDPVSGDAFNVTLTGKTFQTVDDIADFSIALNEKPSSKVTHTPINGEKIAVSYTEKVNGKEILITYYTA